MYQVEEVDPNDVPADAPEGTELDEDVEDEDDDRS